MSANAILRARDLGKRFRGHWVLEGCTLDLPAGRVIGLVGPDGAGKSTLLALASGMLKPSAGTIEVCGDTPATTPAQMAKVGFVAQDAPAYATLSVADHLRLGAHLNARWDEAFARERIGRLGLDPQQKAGRLSGGQRAQLALTIGLAKRPELLLLDEPVASLDPLARRTFLGDLMEAVADQELHRRPLVPCDERPGADLRSPRRPGRLARTGRRRPRRAPRHAPPRHRTSARRPRDRPPG